MPEALERLGFDDRLRELFEEPLALGLVPGRVARVDRGYSMVVTEDGAVRAEVAMRLVEEARNAEDFPAVGDWVALRSEPDMDVPIIETVLPRTSAFVRRDPKEATEAQVLAANVDVTFIVHALADDPNISRIERELVLAWESGSAPALVLNKVDLCDDVEAAMASVEPIALGVPVVLASASDGAGMDEISALLGPGRTGVLLGPSGVGKSTIVNRLVGSDLQATAGVREGDHKGRHTTVARELIELPDGGLLIDTPGLRALALWDADDGMSLAFADIEELAQRCRFRDCAHDEEPGCAVREAVERGEIDERRFDSYHRLARELDYLASRQDARARAEREARWKHIRKASRELNKRRGRE